MNWERGPVSRGGPGVVPATSPAAAAAVDVAVLQELRAIREDLGDKLDKLAEKVGQSATRDDLEDYVRKEEFNAHVSGHQRVMEGWRSWLPIALSTAAFIWIVLGPYVHFGPR